MIKIAGVLGDETLRSIHDRVVQIAREERVAESRSDLVVGLCGTDYEVQDDVFWESRSRRAAIRQQVNQRQNDCIKRSSAQRETSSETQSGS